MSTMCAEDDQRLPGLKGNPARQAHDTFRGYIYQILRSIVVWLDLGDEEQPFLEGAEDLDRMDGNEALTEQVKDTVGSGNITLRTASVVDAINNSGRTIPAIPGWQSASAM
jgi:hypothetical protein